VAVETKTPATPSKTSAVTSSSEVSIETPATRSRKRKKKTSKELKPFEKLDRDLSKAERRVAKAVLAGVSSWESGSKKSSKKKRDGAVRDALKNSVRAYSKYMDKASSVSSDVVNLLYPYKG
jgi:hypothetical protein